MSIAIIRDAAIILLALESIIIGALIVVLLWQIWRLIKLIQTEIKPMIDSANETMSTMRGTTEFVSETVVSPVVRLHSTVAGIKGGMQALFGKKAKRSTSQHAPTAENPSTDIHEQD